MPSPKRRLQIIAPTTLPEIVRGDDLADLFLSAMEEDGENLADGDIVVVAQKVVSKAEGRTVDLGATAPSAEAAAIASETGKDARVVHHILAESTEIVRKREGLIIARHRNGCVVANAGIDLSNAGGDEIAILLPEDADRSARTIAENIEQKSGIRAAVVINDSMGRAWRMGTTGTAIGSHGLEALQDRRGDTDRDGIVLQSSEIAIADEVAAAASLLMGQGSESLPIAVLRGLDWAAGAGCAADLVRPAEQDLFR